MKRKDALWVMQMCRDRDARSEAEREAFDTAIEALKSESIFTADRTKGEWVFDRTLEPHCSECNYVPDYSPRMDDYFFSDFCPNCGADMRERSEE